MLANIVCCVLNFYHPGLQVRLVGRMLNKLDRVTDVSFTLDDGTGRVPVNRWWDAMYRFIVLNKLWIISWLCTDFYFFSGKTIALILRRWLTFSKGYIVFDLS